MAEIEELIDIKGSEHLALSYGDRFLGWYFSKTEKGLKELPIKNNLTYPFKIFDYNYRFIMIPKIEFNGGLITYTTGERLFGIFRFPRDVNGEFVAPISLKPRNLTISLSEKEVREIMSMKKPLVFEAFRIPQFGFEFIGLDEEDLKKIELVTDRLYVKELKKEYEIRLQKYINEVLEKIKSSPNFLLILQNVLNKKLDLNEAAWMTDQIICIK